MFKHGLEVTKIDIKETIKEELIDIIWSLPLQRLIAIKNLFNLIEKNYMHIKLDDYKIFELICYQQTKGSEGIDNTLKEDYISTSFTCRMEKL